MRPRLLLLVRKEMFAPAFAEEKTDSWGEASEDV